MTHKHITDPELRQALAREYAALRRSLKGQKPDDMTRAIMFGMESIAWSIQNARNTERAKVAA